MGDSVTEVPERRTVEDLAERDTEIKARLEELQTEFEGQAFHEAEKAEWDALQEEREDNDRLAAELSVREEAIRSLSSKPENTESGASFHTSRAGVTRGDDIYDLTTIRASVAGPGGAMSELRDRSKRAIERMQFPQLDSSSDWRKRATREDVQSHIERLLEKHDSDDDNPNAGILSRRIVHTADPAYRRAFMKQCAGRPLSAEEQRKLSLTSTEGGAAVPVTLDPTIIPTSNSVVNPARAISRIETLVGSNTWNGVSSGAITASRVAEEDAATDNAPTLAAPTATVTKAHAFIPFSIEVGEDWGALEAEMGKLLQDSKDDEEGAAFVTGSGATVNPQGFMTGSTNAVAAATGLTVTAANLYALEAALPPRFRPNETFVANRGIYNVIRGIDTAGGAALWLYVSQGLNNQVPAPGNTGALLLGRPAYEASAMQATVVNATKIAIVGDFNYFLIVDRIGMQIEVIPHLFGAAQGNLPTGRRGIYAWWRNTSKTLSANAFRHLTGTT
jgi:HK97 family phage major capsid protein